MTYTAKDTRYGTMQYNRCGISGLKLPLVSLGFWHNFGDNSDYANMKNMCYTAFDNGITHFDLANNYGPDAGSAERNLGKILKEDFAAYRDELIISTKAGYTMWDGPYGETLWRLGKQKISHCKPRPKPASDGPGLCGYLLPPPYGPGDTP